MTSDLSKSDAPRVSPAASVFVDGLCAPENRRFLLAAAILASALGFIDGSVVAIAMPAMRSSLDASLFEAQWIHNAYMLTVASLILVGGAMGDRFGLVRVFGAGIVLFVGASMICSVAPSAMILIAARGIQGIGASMMIPGSLALIARAYPHEERGKAIGIWAAASAMTTALGPIIGGLALSFGGPEMWRWIFAVNLPLGGLAVWILWAKTHRDTPTANTSVDFVGAGLATLSLLCIAWGLTSNHGGRPELGWIAGGLVLLVLFLRVEARAPHPMMPLSLFKSRVFSAANLLSFSLYCGLGIMFFFMPMTFIAGWGISEIDAAAAFAPMSVFIAMLSARAGKLADRIGPAPLLGVGSLIVALGYGAMGWLAPQQDFWGHVLPSMCLVGIGMALVVAPLSTAIMGAVEEDQSGIASGINNAVTRMSGLISVAAAGGIATMLYERAGGLVSFGVESTTPGHSTAMTTAFVGLAYIAAGLSLISALLAVLVHRQKAG